MQGKIVIAEYINAALEKATYEKIEDENRPYYGQVRALRGVWATGRTLEECRKELADVIEGWIIVRLRKGLTISAIIWEPETRDLRFEI